MSKSYLSTNRPIKIGIDARILQTGFRHRGMGTYSYNLIKNIIELNKDYELAFYVFKNEPLPDILEGKPLIKLSRHRKANIFWQQFITLKGDVDIFHNFLSIGPSVEIVLPYFQARKTIGTVYDLTFYKLPDSWSQFVSGTRDYRLQINALKKARSLITISSYVKNDLIKTFGLPADKINTVYGGVDLNIFKPVESAESIKRKYNIKGNFILSIGDVNDYKKNIETLLNLIDVLPEHTLVIRGNPGNGQKPDDRVIFINELSQEELVLLYNSATALVFPSISEGFGLPVLEAMGCGCPVISSDRASLPEIVANAGIQVPPFDTKGILEAIKRVTGDKEFRQVLINRGLIRAKIFSWKSSAEQVLQLYKKISET